jgi:hypothetical protein
MKSLFKALNCCSGKADTEDTEHSKAAKKSSLKDGKQDGIRKDGTQEGSSKDNKQNISLWDQAYAKLDHDLVEAYEVLLSKELQASAHFLRQPC